MIELVPATDEDIRAVAANMRAIEVEECRAFGRSPEEALQRGRKAARICHAARLNGEPVAVYGLLVISLMGGVGSPWMLGTDEIGRHGRDLMRIARATVAEWQAVTPFLHNNVHAENAVSIRWLTRLGFTVEPRVADIGGQPMRRFWKGP